jgi:DnaK suppressor protein
VNREENVVEELRKSLLERRAEIIKEARDEIAKYTDGDTRKLVESALDEGDWAVVDITEDLNLRLLSQHRLALIDIDDTLRKIRDDKYGICEECGQRIDEKRLRIMPTARLCIEHQEKKEKQEVFGSPPGL